MPRPNLIRPVDRPVQVGDAIWHRSWNGESGIEPLEFTYVNHQENKFIVCYMYGRHGVSSYFNESFQNWSDWSFVKEGKPPEPKKSGFGKWSKLTQDQYGV